MAVFLPGSRSFYTLPGAGEMQANKRPAFLLIMTTSAPLYLAQSIEQLPARDPRSAQHHPSRSCFKLIAAGMSFCAEKDMLAYFPGRTPSTCAMEYVRSGRFNVMKWNSSTPFA